MSVLEWKMFNFFKLVPLNTNYKFESIKDSITSYCSNSAYKIFCTVRGAVYVFTDWECLSFQISDNPIKFCSIANESEILIILNQYGVKNEIEVKIYNISKLSKSKPAVPISTATIECHCEVMTLRGITLESQVCLAIGLENGSILFCKTALSRDISSNFKSIGVCSKSIKGIEFLQNKMGDVKMFACSDAGVFCYTVASNNNNLADTKVILDDVMNSIHCWTLQSSYEKIGKNHYFVVGRIDALYCYTVEGRGPCYAIDGPKQIVKWFGSHLIVVLQNSKPWQLHAGQSSQFVVINIENKMIVLNQELNNTVVCILPTADFSNCFIFLTDGRIFTLQERELKYKLKLLYSKSLYDIAIKLMEDSNTDPNALVNALVRYGDYLFQRGDILAGVKMYMKTIGLISPFYIIKKLLNSRHNEYLILYLRVLVESDYKSDEHVKLLRNCCRRIEMSGKVAQIFHKDEVQCNSLQVNSYIVMEGRSKISTFFNVIYDCKQFSKYFSAMSDIEMYEFFEEFGHWFMNYYPKEITFIIKYLTSERYHLHDLMDKLTRYFLPLLLMNKQCAFDVISNLHIVEGDMSTNSDIYIISIELGLQMWTKGYIDMDFLIKYFKSHSPQLCADNAFIVCRTYQFWPGIIMMYERCYREILSMRYLVKCFEMNPRDMIDFLPNANNGPSHQIWIQSLSKVNLDADICQNFVNLVLDRMVTNNPNYILNVLQSVVSNKNLHLSHLSDLFSKDNFLIKFKSNDLYIEVTSLEKQVCKFRRLLYNYMNCPIEFRSRLCDICKQSIKHPTVYFLCQHSFHRECIFSISEGFPCCISCQNVNNSERKSRSYKQSMSKEPTTNQSCALKSITHKLGCGINLTLKHGSKLCTEKVESCKPLRGRYDNISKLTKDEISITPNTFGSENNSYDINITFNEYDANLNPFEQNIK